MGIIGLLFGTSYRNRARRDNYRPRTVFKNLISPINNYGTCFSCNGSGKKEFSCRVCRGSGKYKGECQHCEGSGIYTIPAKPCFTCQGTGRYGQYICKKCQGTGEFKPIMKLDCRWCSGAGEFSSTCKKCGGNGSFSVTCKKCSGSGWHRY